ncbi:MAG: rhodanese-like domain-containing protein [Anaerolineae bacterium]
MKNRKIIIGIVGLIVVVAVGLFVALNSTVCCAGNPVQALSPAAYQEQFASKQAGYELIDVRTPEEFATGHIHGAVNIPVDEIASRLSEVPQGQPVVVYCRSGNRSAQAAQILAQNGYSSIYDLGGIIDWTAQGFPIE